MYCRNVNVDWGLVLKLAVPGKVTRPAYKVFGTYAYDRFLTKVSDLEFDNSHLKRFYYSLILPYLFDRLLNRTVLQKKTPNRGIYRCKKGRHIFSMSN
jgi:hypothetical protein